MSSIKKYIAEMIGTFVLTLFGCGTAVVVGCGTTGGIVATALAFGLSIVAMAYVIGNVSGCHINPAVSLAMFLDKRMSGKDMAGYMVFQIVGAIIAAAVLSVIVSSLGLPVGNLGQNSVDNVGVACAILVEVILTFVFVLLVLGATSKNGAGKHAGIVIGLGLTFVHLFGINLTGTSVNPARSIGPALLVGGEALSQLWVFIVAPLIGAIVAWAVWKYLLDDGAVAEA